MGNRDAKDLFRQEYLQATVSRMAAPRKPNIRGISLIVRTILEASENMIVPTTNIQFTLKLSRRIASPTPSRSRPKSEDIIDENLRENHEWPLIISAIVENLQYVIFCRDTVCGHAVDEYSSEQVLRSTLCNHSALHIMYLAKIKRHSRSHLCRYKSSEGY